MNNMIRNCFKCGKKIGFFTNWIELRDGRL